MDVEQPLTDEVSETELLCRFVHETAYDDLPEDVLEHATKMIVDSVGVALAAIETEAVSNAYEVQRKKLDDGNGARVPGLGETGHPEDVSHLFGIMAHALDFDDVHQTMGGHPSVPVLSALLPVAEYIGASGRDLVRSFVIGTDVEIRLANALNPGHYERGWHPTAVFGTIGAAAAVGDLLELKVPELQNAIGIAASKAAGMKGNFGTMTKALHVGDAARNGQEAATLAKQGFTGNKNILEIDFGGFCDLFKGDTETDLTAQLPKLGTNWALLDPPVGFKPYPCCGSTHAAIDAALALRDRVNTAAIESIRIEEHPRRLGHTNRPAPTSPLDAKFSVQYCVAVSLLEGDIWLEHFTSEAVEKSRNQVLLDKIEVVPASNAFAHREWGAELTVETAGGRQVETVEAPTGSAENPLSWEDIEQKYRRCAAHTLSADAVDASLESLQSLPDVEDITTVLDRLT